MHMYMPHVYRYVAVLTSRLGPAGPYLPMVPIQIEGYDQVPTCALHGAYMCPTWSLHVPYMEPTRALHGAYMYNRSAARNVPLTVSNW